MCIFDLNVRLNHCTCWIIPQSAWRGHSLTASGQPPSPVITKNGFIFHIHAQTGLQTLSHTCSSASVITHVWDQTGTSHICMSLLERSRKYYVRYGQLPFCNKQYKPQSQTGGAGSAPCQVTAVTSTV